MHRPPRRRVPWAHPTGGRVLEGADVVRAPLSDKPANLANHLLVLGLILSDVSLAWLAVPVVRNFPKLVVRRLAVWH